MTQPVDVDLNLGGDYVQGVQQATTATEGLSAALNTVQAPARGVQAALDQATPSRAHIAAWGGFVTAAGYFQAQTSGIRATAAGAGQSVRQLDGDVQRLARSFPVGTAGAVAMVQAVQGLGVSQQRVLPLAITLERLGKATSTYGPDMAQNFGQLNREIASLDPARVGRMGDVVTTLSAKTGASAMGLISFSRSIAPVAQQAGIGETAVLGISSAFVKLGDDGGAAGTAVNKILSDLNRSVREGSNDMAAYAQITGMTVGRFRELYQANPARALSAVTTAIGRAPSGQGQMMLESLGLDGVRTQRALLQLSQSGGLDAAINQAVGAYGNGSTQRAAAAALGGLDDSLTELRSTAGQTADALGGPFLHILTRIVDVAKTGLAPVNAVLGSGVGQASILGLGAVAVTGMLARRAVRPLGTLALGAQAATSGPVRSLAGGYALGRGGDLETALSMRTGQFGSEALAMQAYGAPYGRGFMQPVNRGFLRAGNVFGQLRSDIVGPYVPGQGGGSILRRGAAAGVAASSMAYEGYLRTFADPFHQAVTPAGDRVSLLTPREGGLFSQANQVRQAAGVRAALGFLEREGTGTAAMMGRLSSATLGATRAVATFAGRTVEAGAIAAGGVGRGLLNVVGGASGAALLGGVGAYELIRHGQSQVSSINDQMRNTDVYAVENSWLDAVGAASKGATSMADAMASATDTINSAVTNFASAKTVSPQDIVAAGRFNPSDQRSSGPVNYTLGGVSGAQGLAQASALTGMTPQDVQGLKQSLIKQGLPADRINAILGGLQTGGTGGRLTSNTIGGLITAYSAAVSSYNKHGHGLLDTDEYAGRDAGKVAQIIAGGLGQQQSSLTQQFGSRYATQQTVRSIADLMKRVPEKDRFSLSHAIAASLGFRGSGGAFDIGTLLSMPGVSIGGLKGQDLQSLLSGPTLAAHLQPSIMEGPLRSVGASSLLPFFGSAAASARFRPGQRAAEYIAAGHEQDAAAQADAINQIVNAATKAGTSLVDFSLEATKATSVTAGWQQTLLQGLAQEAQFRQQVSLQGAGRAQVFATTTSTALRTLAAGPGTDPNGFQAKQYAQAKQDLADQQQSIMSFYQQRVMAQYQYQIQVGRAQEDFQRQSVRSEQDFLISRQRSWRDFGINLSRQIADSAQTLYNPYQRIQAKPVWDAANLMGNRGEQIGAMRRQISDLRRLRELGLSQAAIDQLQLYDPQNYQQVEQLLSDLSADRGGVRTLNVQAAQVTGLSRQLVSQSPEFRRQQEDFKRAMSDQQSDFNRQRSRAQQDYSISMTRMGQDLRMQDLEITNNMTELTADMNKILHGQTLDLSGQVNSTLRDTLASVLHYAPLIHKGLTGASTSPGGTPTTASGVSATGSRSGGGYGNAPVVTSSFSDTLNPRTGTLVRSSTQTSNYVAPGTGTVYTGGISGSGAGTYDYDPVATFMRAHPADPNYNRSIAKHMMPGWAAGAAWTAWNNLWTRESGWDQYADNAGSDAYGIPQALPGTKMSTAGRDWRTNPATQIRWGIDYIRGRYGSPQAAMAHETKFGWYGAGSVFTGPRVIGIGEKGPEAAIPLNAQGLAFMVAALRQYVGASDAKLIASGGLAHATHISNDVYTYDNRLDMRGSKVEVKANSPREMGDAMRDKEAADNFVGRRR